MYELECFLQIYSPLYTVQTTFENCLWHLSGVFLTKQSDIANSDNYKRQSCLTFKLERCRIGWEFLERSMNFEEGWF